MYRINDTIRYVSSIHWYDTRYVSRYVSYHLLNTNIAETVIKLKSHICFMQIIFIEAGIEHVCNISNRNFQKFPLAFRAICWRYFLLQTILFVQCECRINSYRLWQSPKSKNWSNTRLLHLHHNDIATWKWRASLDATISWTRPRLRSHSGWAVTRLNQTSQSQTQSASSSAPATLPRFFSRVVYNGAARGSLLEITRFVLHFYCVFLKLFRSYRTVLERR